MRLLEALEAPDDWLPEVAYHGTTASIWSGSGDGILYLTANFEHAVGYAREAAQNESLDTDDEVLPIVVSVNPRAFESSRLGPDEGSNSAEHSFVEHGSFTVSGEIDKSLFTKVWPDN